MEKPIRTDAGAWKRWVWLAGETIAAWWIITWPFWDGVTTIPPR